MTEHLDRVVAALERHDCRPRRVRDDHYRAHCPGPGHRRRDLKPSLGVTGFADKVLMNCFVCGRPGKAAILAALGLKAEDLFAPSSRRAQPTQRQRRRCVESYRYEDIEGDLLAEKLRYEPKHFRWRSPTAHGGLQWRKAQGVTLYRLPHLIDAPVVVVTEGEKGVNLLTRLGLVATCPPTGSSAWHETYAEALWRAGARLVVVLPDNDVPGRDHARRVAESCHGFRPNIQGLRTELEDPLAAWPCADPDDEEVQPLRAKLLELDGLPYRGDVCDWFNAGYTPAELRDLIDAALDLDEVRHAKRQHKRRVDRDRQRRHRSRRRAAALRQAS